MLKSVVIRMFALACVALLAAGAPAPAEQVTEEMKAQVPELHEFHKVIYQLWHKAWPNKDYAMFEKLLPGVHEGVKSVAGAELPGILRDKRPKWEAGVNALEESARAYESAVASGDRQGMLDAAEELHARFERLVRIIRPATKEIDAYHVELYKVYHHQMPERDLVALKETVKAMVERCGRLEEADLPPWLADRADEMKPMFAELCRRTDSLARVADKSKKWRGKIDRAVESVHDQYQAVEHSLE